MNEQPFLIRYWAQVTFVVVLLGSLIGGARSWQSHLDDDKAREVQHSRREQELCFRILRDESVLLKYYPAETASFFYPGATQCP